MKVRSKLLVLYVIGGLLPLLIFGFVLIRHGRDSFIQQAKENDAGNVNTAERQTAELFDSICLASRYFNFDEDLERIASTRYENYVDMVEDFNHYRRFNEYGTLYADQVSSFSVYMDNPTLRSNADFVYADESIRAQDWYKKAADKNTVVHWMIVPRLPQGELEPALTRRITKRDGTPVGILVMHIREQRIQELLDTLSGSGWLISGNDTLLVEGTGEQLPFADFTEVLGEHGGLEAFARENKLNEGRYQGNIEIGGKNYLLTGKTLESKRYTFAEKLDVLTVHPYQDILEDTFRQTRNYYGLLAVSAAVSLLLIAFFSSSFSKRISRFRLAIEKTAEGEYGFEQKLEGKDEISELYNHLGRIIRQMQEMNLQIQEEKLKSERLRTAQREAELKMLNMQINPHFLYNTLETIRMKARIEKQFEIEEIVKRLAKLLRYTLEVGDKDVPLKKEMEAVEAYLLIQQHRLGGRFEALLDIPEELGNCLIMPLLIQPLAENAMIHALEGMAEDGRLLIKIREKDGDLHVLVQDNGPGIEPERLREIRASLTEQAEEGRHIGLRNVHQRLQLRFGGDYGLRIESTAGEGTSMYLRMPKQDNEKMTED